MIEYTTGREYNGPQVLEIIVENKTVDTDYYFVECTVTFNDKSRGIAGRLTVFTDDPCEIGKRVLAVYDSGNYELI